MPQVTLELANTAYRLLDLLNKPMVLAAALAGLGAGNVDNGDHRYAVSFVGPYGESPAGPMSLKVTIADKTVNGQVALTGIPIGPPGTTARKIYRTHAGVNTRASLGLQQTIADNATVTANDNTADAGLGAAPLSGTDASGLRLTPGMFINLDLQVPAASANTADIFIDFNNPNISATNFGRRLVKGDPVTHYTGGAGRVAAADVWLFTTADAQTVDVMGEEK